MEKETIREKLKEFYRVSSDVLGPDNCTITKRKNKIFVSVEHMGGRVWKDVFFIDKGNLRLIQNLRPKGDEGEVLFLPEK